MARDFYTSLVYARQIPLLGKLSYYLLKMFGVEIPLSVPIGENFELAQRLVVLVGIEIKLTEVLVSAPMLRFGL